jgi:multiple sugar transport system substrate-binding protein
MGDQVRVRRALAVTAAVGSLFSLAACTGGSDDPGPTPTASSPATPRNLTFGVFGPAVEIRAFQATVAAWNSDPDNVEVELKSWPTRAAMRKDLESGTAVPDVFLASRTDLSWILDQQLNQPVDELLDERGVGFGDNYSRGALEAFSAQDRLQCMPYGVAPEVVYYNKRLVNFTKMANRGIDAPSVDATSWSFDQFAAAAAFASRPGRGTKGVHVPPTLDGLSPFIESGGGSVFDDASQPTSLAFSSDGSRSALERTLELLRNPQVTLDNGQLLKASALSWFEKGKLGMIVGTRALVPALREVRGLRFDVMPMPKLDGSATVGDVTGLCLSADSVSSAYAADFMVHEISNDSVGTLARTGYLSPANVAVALSDDFLQPDLQPKHAAIFNSSVRSMSIAPLIDTIPALEDAVAPNLEQLVYGVGVLDLDAATTRIDEQSKTVLDPESVSDSASPSESPTD